MRKEEFPKESAAFDIYSPVSLNRLGEDNVRNMCLHVCMHVFVFICDLHVHVNLSYFGVSYCWQEIVGCKVRTCVSMFTFFLMRPKLNVGGSHSGRQGTMRSTQYSSEPHVSMFPSCSVLFVALAGGVAGCLLN